jgi:hypothetical protein
VSREEGKEEMGGKWSLVESREEKGVERSGVEGWKRSEAKGEQW